MRFSSLGDVVLTTPLVRALKERHPHAEITYVTKREYAPLLEHNPNISRLISLEPAESLTSLVQRIGKDRFHFQFDLHSSLRSIGLRILLGGSWTGYDKMRFRRSMLIHVGIDLYGDSAPVAERYFTAAGKAGATADGKPPEVFAADNAIRIARKLVTPDTILLAPGARHVTKMWPVRHWRSLAATLLKEGHSVFAVGQPDESEILDPNTVPGAFNIGLDVAIAITNIARLVVSNDSGFMHLATAVGTPAIAMFGPTVRQFGFFPYAEDATVVERDLGCRPCSASGSKKCHLGHHACLDGIPASQIVSLIEAA